MSAGRLYGYVTVPEGTPAMNVHRYDTASGYDTLVPTPGTYPVVKGEVAGTVQCDIPATRVETFCEKHDVEHLMGLCVPDTYTWTAYAFQVKKPLRTDIGTFQPVGAPGPQEAA